MLKRITTAGVTLAALGAFALGGSVIASANPTTATHMARAEAPGIEADGPGGPNVQSGDQTTPDTSSATATSAERSSTKGDPPGGANLQSGDQTTPDTSTAKAEKATSESSTTETPSSEADGPGGHQDPPGANSNNQQQGQN